MAARIDMDVNLAAWYAAMAYMDINVDRGTMWAMREAGRAIREQGRATVPVLTGRLRNSIAASREIKGGGHSFTMTVGPYGPRVALYSGKIQARTGFMDPSAGTDRIRSAMESGQRKLLGRFG